MPHHSPGVSVLDVEHAPGERSRHHSVEAAAHGDAGAVLRGLELVRAALGVAPEGSAAIVPFVQQLAVRGQNT